MDVLHKESLYTCIILRFYIYSIIFPYESSPHALFCDSTYIYIIFRYESLPYHRSKRFECNEIDQIWCLCGLIVCKKGKTKNNRIELALPKTIGIYIRFSSYGSSVVWSNPRTYGKN
jgi:hypothetical protein